MKRTVAFLLIALLVLTGCTKTGTEETAAVGEYVEGETKTETVTDIPEKVDNSNVNTSEPSEAPSNEPSDEPVEEPSDEPSDEPTNEPAQDEPSNEPSSEPSVEYEEGNRIRIVSYNIRYTDDPGGNSIDERAPRLKAVLDKYDPDLVGFQEATPNWIEHIYEDYGDEYEIRYQYRSESNKESTPLMFKKDKFELLDEGYFWLSETPEKESKGWGASLWRICNWVKLEVKATGKVLLFYNTHFDGGEDFHVGAGNLIISRAKALGGFSKYPVFLTGDFNMTPWSTGYSNLLVDGDFADVNEDLEQDKSTTTDGYNETDGTSGHIIDFVFYSPDTAIPLKYQVLNEKVNGGYVSDHRGLCTEVALK